jgi:hypothetical protein
VRALFPYLSGKPEDRDAFDRQADVISARLAQFARMLNEGGASDPALTLGDCGYPITFAWIAALDTVMELGIAWPDEVVAYKTALTTHRAVAAELASYGPVLVRWLKTGDPDE